MAADWRHRFHKDVVVDLVGYRRRASHHATATLFVLPNPPRLIAYATQAHCICDAAQSLSLTGAACSLTGASNPAPNLMRQG